MATKRAIAIGVAVALVGVFIGLVVFAFSWRPNYSEQVEAMASLPVVLTPDLDTVHEPGTSLTLSPDGKAELTDFPLGRVDADAETTCMEWDGHTTYSGSATWASDEGYRITIRTEEGETVIAPYNPPRSDVVWYRFGLLVCGDEPLWYWAED